MTAVGTTALEPHEADHLPVRGEPTEEGGCPGRLLFSPAAAKSSVKALVHIAAFVTARCRAELGQVTDALAALQGVLNVVWAVDSDVSEEAVELRHNIGMLLLAQGRAAEARQVLEPLHEDMCRRDGCHRPDAQESRLSLCPSQRKEVASRPSPALSSRRRSAG